MLTVVQHGEAQELHLRRRVRVLPCGIGTRGWGGLCDIRTGASLATRRQHITGAVFPLFSVPWTRHSGIILFVSPETSPVQSDLVFARTQRHLFIRCVHHSQSRLPVQGSMLHF